MKAHRLIELIGQEDGEIKKLEVALRTRKAKRQSLEDRLLKLFAKGKIDTLRSGKMTAVRKESVFPSIKDRAKFLKFVIAKKAYDLFQNRVSATALKDRTEAGEKVPGVEYFRKSYISLTKKR